MATGYPEWAATPLASLRLLQVGGARLSATLAARIPAEIGCQLQQVFGMAEGLVNYTRLDDSPERIINTRGRPMCPDDEVWVADADGNPLPPGEIGRLMTRGPYTFAAISTVRNTMPAPLTPTVFTVPAI